MEELRRERDFDLGEYIYRDGWKDVASNIFSNLTSKAAKKGA